MKTKLPRKTRKSSNFVLAAKKKVKIQAVSLNEQEIFVLKSLAALCGGSGVGQAPELPQRAVFQPSSFDQAQKFTDLTGEWKIKDNLKFRIQNSESETEKKKKQIFLPCAPQFLNFFNFFPFYSLLLRELLTGRISLFVDKNVGKLAGQYFGKKIQEFKVKFGLLSDQIRREKELLFYCYAVLLLNELRIYELKNSELKNEKLDRVIEVKTDRIHDDIFFHSGTTEDQAETARYETRSRKLQIGKVRNVIRKGVGIASYLMILLAFVGLGFTYLPVLKAEIAYNFKNFQFSIFNFQRNSETSILKNEKKDFQSTILKNNKVVRSDNNKVIVEKTAEQVKGENTLKELPLTSENELDKINFVSDISLAIPKIDAYSQIFLNVNPALKSEYLPVLQKGVAHAAGTSMPGEVGNFYVFAHSAGDLLEMARMNAVFYLLSKLDVGDKVYVKFGDRKFMYTVYDKKIVNASEIGYINNRKDNGKMMTLQTCTPPGTDWQRLLVFAKIEE